MTWAKQVAKSKIKPPKVDGLSPKDKQKLRSAIRQIWHRSHPRKLCQARAINGDGFPFCERCKKVVPKVTIDHVEAVGELGDGFIERMFTPSKNLRALCHECHKIKTKVDNAKTKKAKAQKDFY